MKKQVKRFLSVGLCLALGLSVGGGLAACNGDNGNPTPTPDTSLSPYYLAGSGNVFLGTKVGEGTDAVGGEWYEKYTDAESIPEAIHFVRSTTDGNIHTITVDLYENNEFGILTAGKGWTGQMGMNIMTETEDEYFVEGGGYDIKNIKAAESGNYTFTLNMSGETPTLTYERNGDAPKLPVAVSGVTLDKSSLTLEVGGDATLTATVAPEDADDKTVTWSSDKESVATVANGKVTAVAEGEATITATAGGKSATCKVIVAAAGSIVEVTGVTLNKETVTLHAGGDETLTATVAPEDATNKTVVWSTSDDTIATVDEETGKITAVSPGVATVTATASGKTAECEVTVATDYYLRGDVNSWGIVAALGAEKEVYFTETAEKGVFKTESIELKKSAGFQIAIVGAKGNNPPANDNGWAGAITKTALSSDATTAQYLEAAASGDNIVVKTRGMYTITLDTTGDNPVVSCVLDEELEAETAVYYLIGGGVAQGWTTAKTEDAVASGCLLTDNGDGTATVTVELEADGEFEIAIVGSEWTGALGGSAVDAGQTGELNGSGDNIKATAAGTYVIVLNLETSKITYTFTAAA